LEADEVVAKTTGSGNMKWYVVMTGPRAEELANRNLKQLGFHTFYPHERVRRRRKRANIDQYLVEWVNMPYYPRYMFLGLRDGEGLYGVNECDGVSTVVYSGDRPLEVPHAVMDELMAMGDSAGQVGAVDRVSRGRFRPGQRVRFDNGPMSGLIAEISLDNGKEVGLWVDMLGGRRQVFVDPGVVAEIAT
jgi:transcription antitermination factor NusG